MNTVGSYLTRWRDDGLPYVVDVTVRFTLAAAEPADRGVWNGEPADRIAPALARYEFRFAGAAPDDPDDPPLTPAELAEMAEWFDAHHDAATESAADALREMEAAP